jgi:hypothetical protein
MDHTYYTIGDSTGPWFNIESDPDHCFESSEEAAAELKLLRGMDPEDFGSLDRTFRVGIKYVASEYEWYPKKVLDNDP